MTLEIVADPPDSTTLEAVSVVGVPTATLVGLPENEPIVGELVPLVPTRPGTIRLTIGLPRPVTRSYPEPAA